MFNLSKCQVCAEKDKRIDDLQAQIKMLSQLVLPSKRTQETELVQREADALLNGEPGPIDIEHNVSYDGIIAEEPEGL